MIKETFDIELYGVKYTLIRTANPDIIYDVKLNDGDNRRTVTMRRDESRMFKLEAQADIPYTSVVAQLDLNDAIYDNEGVTPPSSRY